MRADEVCVNESAEAFLSSVQYVAALHGSDAGVVDKNVETTEMLDNAMHKCPAIIIIGDDFDRAVGPAGFHLPSIRRAIRACTAFAVISCEPLPHVYGVIAITATLTRRNVMLIETRPEQELAWLGLIQKLAPGRPITLATVEGGHA